MTWQRKIDIHLARMELANFSVRADVIDTRPQVLLSGFAAQITHHYTRTLTATLTH